MDKIPDLDKNPDSFFYKFLMDKRPGYRIARHIMLILALSMVALNQVYMGFLEYLDLMGKNIYLFGFAILLTYLIVGYSNLYLFIPRFLIKGKYGAYFTFFILSVCFTLIFHYLLEYFVFKYYEVDPGRNSFYKNSVFTFYIEMTGAFLADFISILGVSVTVFLRHWLQNEQHVNMLEKTQLQSEVNQLKEQVNPNFLFSILNHTANLSLTEQQKASDMLLELSELLRYQLYDCSREKVLLNAEINFITNYLQLEKLYFGQMDFEITKHGDVERILAPPLLFIPVIQFIVKSFQKRGTYFKVNLDFVSDDRMLSFACNCLPEETVENKKLEKIKTRLTKLYKDNYSFEKITADRRHGYSFKLQINL